MKKHPNKVVRDFLKEIEKSTDWEIVEVGDSSHAFCRIRCTQGHSGHNHSVWSTPKSPENMVKQLRKLTKRCQSE